MDHLLYIAMSGAKETMNSLAVRGNNLANANTTGFKSDFEAGCLPWLSARVRTCSMAC